MSPNNSTAAHHHHNNHTSKRQQQFTPTIPQEKQTADRNVNFPSRQTAFAAPPSRVVVDDGGGGGGDDDDDIPPGFGPARDDDDLPEFNFSGPSKPSVPTPSNRIPSRGSNSSAPPLDQIRELIQKYGQPGNNVDSRNVVGPGIQPWNTEDDDDDIPEWQPHAPPPQPKMLPHQPPVHNFQMPVPPPHYGAAMARQPPPPAQVATPLQPPVNMVQGGGRWAQPPGPYNQHSSNLGGHQPSGGRYYGGPAVRSRHTDMDRRRARGGARRN